VISQTVDGGPLLSAAVARILLGALSPESLLMVSNSMPVRELDTFSGPELGPVVVGNRGASGIDGVNSTALGLAAARPDRSAALFTGDLALLHDLGGLLAAARLGLHLTIVCVDNNGGGIFSMLPIARRGGEVDFEQLFLTPPGIELTDLDGLGGIRARTVESGSDLADAITTTMSTRSPGVDLLVVPVDGDADVAQHRAVAAAVSAELAERR
jgi:2-succinyl-5-enolpyruvyl-6-hydroxy-3-cyclohexene-1-carboxylate synthase